jgi:hypothetical protein
MQGQLIEGGSMSGYRTAPISTPLDVHCVAKVAFFVHFYGNGTHVRGRKVAALVKCLGDSNLAELIKFNYRRWRSSCVGAYGRLVATLYHVDI